MTSSAMGQGVTASFTNGDASGSDFDLAGNWSTGAVPGLDDVARFALNQTYDVTWREATGDREVDDLLIQIGSVSFVGDGSGSLTSGSATIGNLSDVTIDGVDLAIEGNAQIQGDVTVTGGSTLAITDPAATLGNNVTLTLNSGAADFDGFVNVGRNGPGGLVVDASSLNTGLASAAEMEWGTNAAGIAQVDFINGSTASLGADVLQFSEFGGTTMVNVSSGSSVETGSVLVASAVNAGQAQMVISGSDSVLRQRDNAALVIGKATVPPISSRGIDPQPAAEVSVSDGAVWHAGSGGVTLNTTGQLSITSGGRLEAGSITVNPGSAGLALSDGGILRAAAFNGPLNSTGGVIEPWSGPATADPVGPLMLSGDALLAESTLRFELRNDWAFDQLLGDSLVTMTGTTQIELPLLDGFRPTPSMAYEVIRADTQISFDVIVGPAAEEWGVDWAVVTPDVDVFAVVPVVVYTQGDFNLDGRVDLLDLDILGRNWEVQGTIWAEGDASGDRVTDLVDLDLLGINWGFGVDDGSIPTFSAALAESGIAVPEPAASLMLTGMGASVLLRRRKVC